MSMIDKNVLEQWEKKLWRKPDVYRPGLDPVAIWYGPAGVEGDVATMVDIEANVITISEYQDITGYSDELPSEDSPFLVQSVDLSVGGVLRVFAKNGVRKPRSIPELLRRSADLGVAYLAYWGGNESYAGELPR